MHEPGRRRKRVPPPIHVEVSLRDGSRVLIRRLRPADAPEVQAAFARLSEESRRLRFLTAKPSLSDSELRYLTDVDGSRHEAICAIDPASGQGVGIGRFVRDEPGSPRAEVAVTVVDAWQRRGLGTILLETLAERAREEGISEFTALVAADNRSMNMLLDQLGAPVHRLRRLGEALEYEIEVAPRGLGARLQDALRAAAQGHWTLPPGLWEALRSLVPVRLRS
jgi:GNAT superfamily N-acetyltransferase